MATRKRITNEELVHKYLKRKEAIIDRLDRAIIKVLRANAHLARVREEGQRTAYRLGQLALAIERGEEYPKERPVKKKRGRNIELD